MHQPNLEKGLLKYKQNNENDENEKSSLINCPCIIGITFTTVICTCLIWLIIKYN